MTLVCFSRYELSARPGQCRNRSRFDQRNETWEVWRLCSIFQISIFTILTIRDKSSELNLRDKSSQFSQSQSCTVVMHLHLNWTAPWWMWQQTDVAHATVASRLKKTCMPWLSAMASAHLGRYQKVPPRTLLFMTRLLVGWNGFLPKRSEVLPISTTKAVGMGFFFAENCTKFGNQHKLAS